MVLIERKAWKKSDRKWDVRGGVKGDRLDLKSWVAVVRTQPLSDIWHLFGFQKYRFDYSSK